MGPVMGLFNIESPGLVRKDSPDNRVVCLCHQDRRCIDPGVAEGRVCSFKSSHINSYLARSLELKPTTCYPVDMTEKSTCPDCERPSVSPPAEVYCMNCATAQPTPEIDRLELLAGDTVGGRQIVYLDIATQAVRDTETRVREEWRQSDYVRLSMEDARAAAAEDRTREIVEALRERVLMRAAADFISRAYLNEEVSTNE